MRDDGKRGKWVIGAMRSDVWRRMARGAVSGGMHQAAADPSQGLRHTARPQPAIPSTHMMATLPVCLAMYSMFIIARN